MVLRKLLLQLAFGSAVLFLKRWQRENDGTVEQIGAGRDVGDAVEDYRPRRIEKFLFTAFVKLPGTEAAARRKSAERIRKPRWKLRDVVEGQDPRVCRRDV